MKYCGQLFSMLTIERGHLQPCCPALRPISFPCFPYAGERIDSALFSRYHTFVQCALQKDHGLCSNCPSLWETDGREGFQADYPARNFLETVVINYHRDLCNARCVYCNWWKRKAPLPFALSPVIRSLTESGLMREGGDFVWGGGECTLLPDLEEISGHIASGGYKQWYNTNGIIYSQPIADTLSMKIGQVRISLDCGTSAGYRKLKGIDAFAGVVETIRQYRAVARDPGGVYLKYIISKFTNKHFREADAFLELAADLGISSIQYSFDHHKVLDDEDFSFALYLEEHAAKLGLNILPHVVEPEKMGALEAFKRKDMLEKKANWYAHGRPLCPNHITVEKALLGPDLAYPHCEGPHPEADLGPDPIRKKRILEIYQAGVLSREFRLEYSPCPVCGEASFTMVSEVDRFSSYAPLCICKTCGMAQVQPMLNDEFLQKYYREIYPDMIAATDFESANPVAEERFAFLKRIGILDRIPQDGIIVDHGCGKGHMVSLFSGALPRAKVLGFDCNPEVIQEGIALGLDLHHMHYSRHDVVRSGVHLLMYWWIMEHIRDLRLEMKKVYNSLREGGIFLATVPNIFNALYYATSLVNSNPSVQANHFDFATLVSFIESYGFKLLYGDESIFAAFVKTSSQDSLFVPQHFQSATLPPALRHDQKMLYLKAAYLMERFRPNRVASIIVNYIVRHTHPHTGICNLSESELRATTKYYARNSDFAEAYSLGTYAWGMTRRDNAFTLDIGRILGQ